MPGSSVFHYFPEFPCSNSCPFTHWCYLTTSSSATLFSSCSQSFLASGCFPMSWLFASGGQTIEVSVSATGLPMNIQGWFSLGLTGFISLQSKVLSRVFFSTTIWKHQFFGSAFFMVQLSHPYMTTGKTIVLTIWTFVGKVISLFFNILSRFVIAFLLRSKYLLISFTWKNIFEDYLCCNTYYSTFLWMNSVISTLNEYGTTFSSV